MKKIKFRGLSKNNEVWVYGFYWQAPDDSEYIRSIVDNHTVDYEVHPKTVGEYTGLKDYSVSEKEIYEGDVLLCREQDEHLEVFYSDGAFRVKFSFDNESTVLTEKLIKANWLIKEGNRHENPELLNS